MISSTKELGQPQESVNQRLNFLVETFEKGKKASFARKIGISAQGVQEMLAGRKSDPSFKVLVKILESYPQVNADWLVLGRGMMMREGYFNESLKNNPSTELDELMNEEASRDLLRYAMEKAGGFDSFMEAFFESMKPGLTDKIKQHYTSLEGFEKESTVYRIEGEVIPAWPYGGLLMQRLSISQNQAYELVGSGRIDSVSVDGSNQPSSLRVTEKAVRKFLGEA